MYQYPYGNAQQLNLDWILNKIQELEIGCGEVDLEEVANALVSASYDTGHSYSQYDYCFYNNKLYRCLNATTGAWNPSDWTEAPIGDDVSILTRLINSAVITDVKFDTSGTNGKLQQKYGASYHDVVEVDYTPVQNSKRPLSSNAGYDLNGAIANVKNELFRNVIIFGDSWSDITQTGGSDKWAAKLADRHPLMTVHNYARGGSKIVGADNFGWNGTVGGQIAAAISDTSYNHNDITDIIIMGGVNDYRGLTTVNETNSRAIGNDIASKILNRLRPNFPNANYIVIINNTTPASQGEYMFARSAIDALRTNYGCRAGSTIGWIHPAFIDSDHIHPTANGHNEVLGNVEAMLFGGDIKYISTIVRITVKTTDETVSATVAIVMMCGAENIITQCTYNITSGTTTEPKQLQAVLTSAQLYALPYFPAWFAAANIVNHGLDFGQNTIQTNYITAPAQANHNMVTDGKITLFADTYTGGVGIGYMISNNTW